MLHRYGTEAQKNHYLPRLAAGAEIPCFALTGPEAGSDAASMPDTGVVCRQAFNGEADVLGIRLNWEKRYITLGPVCTLLGLAFKLYDPDHLIGDKDEYGITAALIPTDTPGVEWVGSWFTGTPRRVGGVDRSDCLTSRAASAPRRRLAFMIRCVLGRSSRGYCVGFSPSLQ